MSTILIVIGVLLFGAMIYAIYHHHEYDGAGSIVASIICGFLAITLIVCGSCFSIVPTGYTGVKVRFQQIDNEPISEGINFHLPFIEKIRTISNKQVDYKVKSIIWGETSEKTPVSATDVIVTFNITPQKTIHLLKTVSNISNVIDDTIVASAVKNAMVDFTATEVTMRGKIEPKAMEYLQKSVDKKYGENSIVIAKLVIDNMDFEESYNEAIAQRSIAIEQKKAQEIINETAISKANADKEVAIMQAQAKSETQRIDAEAKAYAIEVEAKATAEANKKLAESLTYDVIDYEYATRWNGVLPTTVLGESSIPMLNLGEE